MLRLSLSALARAALVATALLAHAAAQGTGKAPGRPAEPDARRRHESQVSGYTKDAIAARSAWEAQGRAIRQLLHKLAQITGQLQKTKKDLAAAQADERKLKREKEIALDELRRGDFCSGCGQTRSAIEATGQRFPHPGQVRRPAKPEDFQKLENEFAAKFATLKARIERLEREKTQQAQEARDLHFQFMKRLPDYHRELAREADSRLRAWNTEKEFLEQQLDGVRERLAASRGAASAEPGADVTVRALERELADQTRRAESAFLRADQEANGYVQAATRDLQSSSDAARPIVETDGVPSGWFIGQTILSPPTPVSCRVFRVRQVGDAPRADARSLLEAGAAPAKSQTPAPKKSARELLEGK